MDRIIESLKKLLPEDQVNEVASAVEESLNESKGEVKEELEKEYNEKLEGAYSELSTELSEAEKTAEQGYEEAFGIITDLNARLGVQKSEFDVALEEGYEEAYQMLIAERNKNEGIEVEMYEEYDNKLAEMKEYIVDKVDEFLQHKGSEIYEQAKQDILNDPRMAEHKVAFDKVVDITADYLSDEDYANNTSAKLDEVGKEVDELKGALKVLEARNIRLSTENNKLNETVHETQQMLVEQQEHVEAEKEAVVIAEQKERESKAEEVEGKGQSVVEEKVKVIAEFNENNEEATEDTNDTVSADEGLDDLLTLAGIKK
jgi:hypothetical protein